jgi:hypothetical protein
VRGLDNDVFFSLTLSHFLSFFLLDCGILTTGVSFLQLVTLTSVLSSLWVSKLGKARQGMQGEA